MQKVFSHSIYVIMVKYSLLLIYIYQFIINAEYEWSYFFYGNKYILFILG